ncbi:MAG: hypothetical protein IJI47_00140 [Eubacterium sp.]|nr:hypothetical protein [Eubacterium sp.]
MKKVISIVLSFAMLATMVAGLNLTAFAADVFVLLFNPAEAISLYEGWHADTLQDSYGQDYYYYYLDVDDLIAENNQFTVVYDDGTIKAYSCVRDYYGDGDEDYDLVYKCGDEELNYDDIEIETDQDEENKWEVGETYTARIVYGGKTCNFNVSIEENPVTSVTIDYDGPIVLAENQCGHWMDDEGDGVNDWFRYYPNNMYLNYAGVRFTVDYANGDAKEFSFEGNDWLPKTEDGEELDGAYLEFGLNQMQNHLTPDSTGRKAGVGYYGKGYAEIPISVISGDIDSGTIGLNGHRKVLFMGNEYHTVTFTPQSDGVYVFEESLADKLIWERNRFDGDLLDENGDVVDSLSNEWMAYVLEGGETYTLKARKIEDSGPMFEFLHVKSVNAAPVSINFTPSWDYYTFYNGNRATDDAMNQMGNQLEVEFSDGDIKTFTCNNVGEYRYYGDGYGDEGIKINDYANEKGVDFDCNLHTSIDAECWDKNGDENYFDIYVGTAYQRYYVDDLIEDSPYKSITMSGSPIEVYNGTAHTDHRPNNQGEWVDYQRYDINRWDLEIEGNTFTVTYPDDSTETFTCVRDEEYGYLEFRSENGNIRTEDFILDDPQNPDNEWQEGTTYDIDVYFRGQKCTFSASVVANPVDYIDVDVDGTIEVFENRNGHWEHDNNTDADYFRYDENYDYLRRQNAVITVYYTDGTEEVYDYRNKDWIPCDETGRRIDERYFDFRFDQDENHFERGAQNKAYVEFYGKRYYLDANVVSRHDVNEGEINAGDTKMVLFLDGEEHSFTFTPAKSGVYEFEDSLVNCVAHNSDFSLVVTDSSDDIVTPLQTEDDDNLFYNLSADEEYTITTCFNRNETSLEYLGIRQRVSVKKIEYSHAGGTITVSDGEFGSGREIYDEGSTLTVTYSDGTVETFTANDQGEFRNDDGKNLYDIQNDLDVYCDCGLRITPNAETWVYDSTSYYTLTVGNVSKKVYVTVEESDVDSIVYHSKKSPELIKDVDFVYEDWNNRVNLDKPPFFTGDTVDVTYKDERGTVTYKFDWDDRFYRDTNDGREEIHLDYRFDDSLDYGIGDEIEFRVAYKSGRTTVTAEVIESDVESIEFTAANPYSVYKEDRGWWEHRNYYDDQLDEHVEEDFFHYDTPDVYRRGNVITVHYTDGTTVAYEYTGRYFTDEDGNRLDNRYIYTHDLQWETHWEVGDGNEYYVVYKGEAAPVNVTVTDLGEWEPFVKLHDSRGNTYSDGDTLFIEKGQQIFVYFETDYRNREHGVADIIGFSDGYDEGTLTTAGFDVRTGNDRNFGYDFGDEYGFLLGTNNLRVGKTATLDMYLYDYDGDDYENFDFVNTPHAADFSVNVEVVDHIFVASNVVPATCTAKGYTEYTCENCGITYRSDFTDYAEHQYTATVTEATPNSKGYTTYSCTNCDYEYIGNITGYASDDDALVAVVNNSSCLESADYSLESFSALTDAVDAADDIEAGDNPQVEIDNAITEILYAITDLQPYLNFSVDCENGTVTQSVENGTYLRGQEITLTASADSGYTFDGWYETGTKRIFSTDASYTFVLTSNTELVALFTPQGESSLVFANKTGQIVSTISKTAAEWAQVNDLADLAPAVPYSYGCTNGAWDYGNALAALQNGENAVVTPIYDESEAFVPEAHAEGNTPAVNLWYTFDSANNVGSFVMAVDIPDGVTVESIGTAFYYKKAQNFDPTQFILTVNNKTATSKFDDLQSGVFVTNMNKMSAYYNWAARGYVNYYDSHGNLKTAYSQQINIVNRQRV